MTPLTSLLVAREDSEELVSLPSSKGYGDLIKGLKANNTVTMSVVDSSWTTTGVQCKAQSQPSTRNNTVEHCTVKQKSVSTSSYYHSKSYRYFQEFDLNFFHCTAYHNSTVGIDKTILLPPTEIENGTVATSTSVQPPLVLRTIDDIKLLSADEDQFELSNGIEAYRVAREGQVVSLLTG